MPDRVNIWEFANGECIFGGCKHNVEGYCTYDDADFLWNRITDLVEACKGGTIEYNYHFNCPMMEVKLGHCKYCGSRLEKVKVFDYEYWGYKGIFHNYECPECN